MTNQDAPIGVFDSGIGGLSVLQALRAELPQERFVYLADNAHAPYGERGDAYVTERSRTVTRYLRAQYSIKALVVACNTATTATIALLRAEHPELPFVGVEPALKPAAALSRTGHIGVMATRGTVTSIKFQSLLSRLQTQASFAVQACDGLAAAIEASVLKPEGENAIEIRAICARYISAMGTFGLNSGDMDTLVLGCTHYVFAAPALRSMLGDDVQLIDTGPPVARQTRRMLSAEHKLSSTGSAQVLLLSTGSSGGLEAAAARWLGLSPAAVGARGSVQM